MNKQRVIKMRKKTSEHSKQQTIMIKNILNQKRREMKRQVSSSSQFLSFSNDNNRTKRMNVHIFMDIL